jgi:RNA polymerase sigma-70 factor (ECF subfamily)
MRGRAGTRGNVAVGVTDEEPGDEELMRRLADGRAEALRSLHARYAGLVFGVAAPALGRAVAEEIVQEVFLTVWRKADSFDPGRGSLRNWVLRIAGNRVRNELRSRSRRPSTGAGLEGDDR